ncbi:MAG TPA: STAS-like domain-containing protein [bacterium]|jgi:hypothetical protein|nr:STAS-like domain-containing protein [bacterium]HPY15679.1 STAS-like domain-containing protein [bacterium]HQB10068.1 STAS-like domain-containing protein [bacterium]
MKIVVKNVINSPRCITKEDGQKIFDLINSSLKNGERTTLDFNEITQFASPFFNFAIGQLLRDISVTSLRSLLIFENLDMTGKQVIERVIENAVQYHSNSQHRDIVNEILDKKSKEFE